LKTEYPIIKHIPHRYCDEHEATWRLRHDMRDKADKRIPLLRSVLSLSPFPTWSEKQQAKIPGGTWYGDDQ